MFCLRCGAPNRDEARFCAGCGAPIAPYVSAAAPGPAPPTPIAAAAPGPPIAGLGDRFFAVIIDLVLGIGVFAAAGMWSARRWGGVTDSGFSMEGKPALVPIGVTLLAAFLYHWLCEGLFGATLGKGILGIVVRRKDGSRCGLAPSLVRNLLRIIDGIGAYLVGFLVAVFSASRQRLGDHLAGTVVVAGKAGKTARAALVVVWIVACAGEFTGAYLLHRGAAGAATGPAETRVAETARQSQADRPARTDQPPSSGTAAEITGDLQIVNVALLQREDGPPRAAAPYEPGDTVYFKYEVVGFTKDADGKIDVLLNAVARDPNGLLLYPPWEKELVQTVRPGRPVDGSLNVGLPSFVPAGAYRIEIKAHDKLKNTDAENATPFQVNAPAVAPAAGLEIRDFALSLSKDGAPADVPVLDGGGTVYMRWKIFGVQARESRVNMAVALRVLNPAGKTVVDEPKYVAVDDTFYYRPPTFCLPMSGHVTLPGQFPKGTYTALYTVTDDIAGSRIAHTAKFRMR